MRDRARPLAWFLGAWLALSATSALAIVIFVAAGAGGAGTPTAQGLAEPLVALGVLLGFPAALVAAAYRGRVLLPATRLAEDVRVMASSHAGHRTPVAGAAELRRIAAAVNSLGAAHEALRGEVEDRVREANLRLERERGRLSALLGELAQSVVVCNDDGRVLLYNARARELLQEPLDASDRGRGTFSMIGLGRSIFTVFDRNVVLHALDLLQDRIRGGEGNPVVAFVTAVAGARLLRVELAAVRDSSGASGGFVMTLQDVTARIDSANRRGRSLQVFVDGVRGALSKIRVAADRAAGPEELAPGLRDELLASIGDEARRLGERVDRALAELGEPLHQEWPLETMRAADLVAAASRRIESRLGLPVKLEEVDESLWVEVDGHSLVQVLAYLAARLVDDFGIREVRFALAADGPRARIEMIWTGAPLGFETTAAWQTDPLDAGGEVNPQTLAQIVARHRGEFRYVIRKLQHRESFEITLPLGAGERRRWTAAAPAASRPEFYDFDLFHQSGQTAELDEARLAALHCTVFDTETTGLRPAEGDEIVAIGAVRIVNGRLLAHEVFEQLVDPGRPMSPEAARITGIDSSMLAGQPGIGTVLPAFHRFCQETVLVAHNAAFDMRFLSLKEQASGVRFDHPVLDTLLLSQVVHPELESHRLEAIAERMGVRPIGRHTALGDAIMTAEVFLRMIPLLERQGIHTLGQAREASRRTRFAKVAY